MYACWWCSREEDADGRLEATKNPSVQVVHAGSSARKEGTTCLKFISSSHPRLLFDLPSPLEKCTRRWLSGSPHPQCRNAKPSATASTNCRHPATTSQRNHWIRRSREQFAISAGCHVFRRAVARLSSIQPVAKASGRGVWTRRKERRELAWRWEEHVFDANKLDRTHTRTRRFGQDKSLQESRSRWPVEVRETAREESRAVQQGVSRSMGGGASGCFTMSPPPKGSPALTPATRNSASNRALWADCQSIDSSSSSIPFDALDAKGIVPRADGERVQRESSCRGYFGPAC